MSAIEVKNIATVGVYSIDGFKFTCDRCGINETVTKKGFNKVFLSIPDDWVLVMQREFNIESHYCRSCGQELGIGC